mmetsp:Transcript_30719/g.53903  ORF Transcript_30719/g.53903 Transcript_30719/m.53903 type:complete len:266 (-) Transcript_30719:291-1088(-)
MFESKRKFGGCCSTECYDVRDEDTHYCYEDIADSSKNGAENPLSAETIDRILSKLSNPKRMTKDWRLRREGKVVKLSLGRTLEDAGDEESETASSDAESPFMDHWIDPYEVTEQWTIYVIDEVAGKEEEWLVWNNETVAGVLEQYKKKLKQDVELQIEITSKWGNLVHKNIKKHQAWRQQVSNKCILKKKFVRKKQVSALDVSASALKAAKWSSSVTSREFATPQSSKTTLLHKFPVENPTITRSKRKRSLGEVPEIRGCPKKRT